MNQAVRTPKPESIDPAKLQALYEDFYADQAKKKTTLYTPYTDKLNPIQFIDDRSDLEYENGK